VLKFPLVNEQDPALLKKWLHDLNNRMSAVLSSAELLQFEQLSPTAMERARLIESKALEIRDIVRQIAEHYLK
jgi:hypothetical protein